MARACGVHVLRRSSGIELGKTVDFGVGVRWTDGGVKDVKEVDGGRGQRLFD